MVLHDKIDSETATEVNREVRSMARRPVPEPANGSFLTVAELAEYFVVGEQTIRAWIKDDDMALPYGRFGKHIRFDASEIQQWVDERWHNGSTRDSDKG